MIVVFDRIPHPGKDRVTAQRLAKYNKNAKLLAELLQRGSSTDFTSSMKLRRETLFQRDDVLKIVIDS
jgi:hypothetical protein